MELLEENLENLCDPGLGICFLSAQRLLTVEENTDKIELFTVNFCFSKDIYKKASQTGRKIFKIFRMDKFAECVNNSYDSIRTQTM